MIFSSYSLPKTRQKTNNAVYKKIQVIMIMIMQTQGGRDCEDLKSGRGGERSWQGNKLGNLSNGPMERVSIQWKKLFLWFSFNVFKIIEGFHSNSANQSVHLLLLFCFFYLPSPILQEETFNGELYGSGGNEMKNT